MKRTIYKMIICVTTKTRSTWRSRKTLRAHLFDSFLLSSNAVLYFTFIHLRCCTSPLLLKWLTIDLEQTKQNHFLSDGDGLHSDVYTCTLDECTVH